MNTTKRFETLPPPPQPQEGGVISSKETPESPEAVQTFLHELAFGKDGKSGVMQAIEAAKSVPELESCIKEIATILHSSEALILLGHVEALSGNQLYKNAVTLYKKRLESLKGSYTGVSPFFSDDTIQASHVIDILCRTLAIHSHTEPLTMSFANVSIDEYKKMVALTEKHRNGALGLLPNRVIKARLLHFYSADQLFDSLSESDRRAFAIELNDPAGPLMTEWDLDYAQLPECDDATYASLKQRFEQFVERGGPICTALRKSLDVNRPSKEWCADFESYENDWFRFQLDLLGKIAPIL